MSKAKSKILAFFFLLTWLELMLYVLFWSPVCKSVADGQAWNLEDAGASPATLTI
jgi:hypothetical protein